MAKKIYKWKVASAPTGRYRSFEHWAWPSATYLDGSPLAEIRCADNYYPARAKEGRHAPLTLHVTNYNCDHEKHGAFQWRKIKGEFSNIDAAKAMLDVVIAANPQILRKDG